jgi:ABC-type uncharacterized transport system auxiliary subunit
MKKAIFYIILLCLFCGCMTVQQDHLDVRTYTLNVAMPVADGASQEMMRLKVRKLKTTAPYDRKQFVYLMQKQIFETDYYNRWDRSLHHMLTDVILDWFNASGRVKEVLGPKSWKPYDYVLNGQVKQFYADFSEVSAYKVVIEIHFTLQSNFVFLEEIFSKSFTANIPIEEKRVGAILQGFNQGLEQILRELEREVTDPDLRNIKPSQSGTGWDPFKQP